MYRYFQLDNWSSVAKVLDSDFHQWYSEFCGKPMQEISRLEYKAFLFGAASRR